MQLRAEMRPDFARAADLGVTTASIGRSKCLPNSEMLTLSVGDRAHSPRASRCESVVSTSAAIKTAPTVEDAAAVAAAREAGLQAAAGLPPSAPPAAVVAVVARRRRIAKVPLCRLELPALVFFIVPVVFKLRIVAVYYLGLNILIIV